MAGLSTQERLERRAKKEMRRQKQRDANLGRAKKMHLARLESSGKSVRNVEPKPLPNIQIGCSGWFYWDWRGTFYPPTLKTSEWFGYYASQFKTVELNAPFYSWPTVGTVKSWLRQAGRRRFVYTVKVCELITHIKRFRGTKELILDFGYIADLLGPSMGCFLFQLPPSYTYTPARLKNILGQMDHRRRNVVEFRHPGWWNEKTFSAFRKTGTIFCSCSGPKLPEDVVRTADDIYVRFHGTHKWYRHNYEKEELSIWAKRIKESGAKRVWAYFNNDYGGHAITNARELMRQLKQS